MVSCALASNDETINFRPRLRSFNGDGNGKPIAFGSSVHPSSESDLIMSPSSEPRLTFLPPFHNRRQPSSVVFPGRDLQPPRIPISFSNKPIRPVNSAINFGNDNPVNSGISFASQPVISASSKPSILVTNDDRRAPIVFGNRPVSNKPVGGLVPEVNIDHKPKLAISKRPSVPSPNTSEGNSNTVGIEGLVPEINEIDNTESGSSTPFDSGETSTIIANPDSTALDEVMTESPCLLQDRSAFFNGVCQPLLEMGPCADNEWVVLSNEGFPECRERVCPWGSLLFNDSCVDPNDLSICPRGQILYVDLQGNTDCDCQDKFFYHPETGECYTRHEQGVCEDNFFMEFNDDLSPVCVENPCGSDDFVFHDGTCYRKNYVGYCEPHLVDVRSGVHADCIFIELFSIFQAPTLRACPRGSRRDHEKRCRAVFRVPTQRTLSSHSGECKFGFKKDHTGTCRRVFDLFGDS